MDDLFGDDSGNEEREELEAGMKAYMGISQGYYKQPNSSRQDPAVHIPESVNTLLTYLGNYTNWQFGLGDMGGV